MPIMKLNILWRAALLLNMFTGTEIVNVDWKEYIFNFGILK